MNAYKIADEIEKEFYSTKNRQEVVAEFVRQQQSRITELEIENNLLRDDVFDLREAEQKLRKAQEK